MTELIHAQVVSEETGKFFKMLLILFYLSSPSNHIFVVETN